MKYIDAEKLKKFLTERYEVCPISDDERHGRHCAIIEIQNFIDFLQQEQPESGSSEKPNDHIRGFDRAYLNEKIAKARKSWDGVEVDKYMDEVRGREPEVDLENYISNKLRELGADLINHKPYSFNRGLNVGETNAYHDILDKLNARKEK